MPHRRLCSAFCYFPNKLIHTLHVASFSKIWFHRDESCIHTAPSFAIYTIPVSRSPILFFPLRGRQSLASTPRLNISLISCLGVDNPGGFALVSLLSLACFLKFGFSLPDWLTVRPEFPSRKTPYGSVRLVQFPAATVRTSVVAKAFSLDGCLTFLSTWQVN